jgi:hypothetical protein
MEIFFSITFNMFNINFEFFYYNIVFFKIKKKYFAFIMFFFFWLVFIHNLKLKIDLSRKSCNFGYFHVHNRFLLVPLFLLVRIWPIIVVKTKVSRAHWNGQGVAPI